MKQIFDWLREQIVNEIINVPTLIRKDYDFDDGLIRARDLINEAEEKWGYHAICYLDSPCEYQNEDIRVDEPDCCEWTIDISNINSAERWVYYNKIGCNPNVKDCLPTFHFSDREQKNFLKYCPYCGKPIKISEVE